MASSRVACLAVGACALCPLLLPATAAAQTAPLGARTLVMVSSKNRSIRTLGIVLTVVGAVLMTTTSSDPQGIGGSMAASARMFGAVTFVLGNRDSHEPADSLRGFYFGPTNTGVQCGWSTRF